ncbi:MAG TPA: phospholipid carrier-dependent glycosyltransferase [Thermoflexia bacterium]|nr:phospholipid carrier-dependent glycosyltransferase [Thermoflexia bacterium]
MKRRASIPYRAIPVLLFLTALIPRLLRPVSRPLVWYLRSAHFIDAVLAGDWANTVYSEHPGVGLMWPVGIGLKVYWTLSGISPAAYTVPPDFEPIHFFGPVPLAEISAGIAPLALLISLGIVVAWWMLLRLFDQPTATAAGFLLALSPYYLTQSKVLHLDAWMATLMLLSALALLLYRRERRRRWLLLSGALGGLATLVKTPAIFLLPFAGLVLLVDLLQRAIREPQSLTRSAIRDLLLPLAIWLATAALVYVALFPTLWVDPQKGLGAVMWGITHHASTAHDTPTYFLGQVLKEDPGPVFYAVALLFRTGEVELTFLAVAVATGALWWIRHRRIPPKGIDLLLLVAYAFFFLAQMSLGAKKMPRYVLPSILALDVLAAAAIVAWARSLAGDHRRWAAALMALPLLVQAGLVLPRHPYYGTGLNWIAGGPTAAARAILIGEEGEGLADLAAYLNERPDAEHLTVAAQLKHVFNQTFRGTTVDIDEPADYLVFHRNYTVRDYKVEQWGGLWERYAPRTPEQEVAFDGVPYAWLYPALPSDVPPEHSAQVHLGTGFRFLGYDLRSTEVAPGDRVPFVLYWQATEPVTADLSIFVHLLAPSGDLVWQDDGAAAHGTRPTWSWPVGETVADPHTIALPADLPEGEYLLTTGLYDWQTGERLPAFGSDGARLAEDRIEVARLTVHHPRTHPAAWIARGLAGLVLASALFATWRER